MTKALSAWRNDSMARHGGKLVYTAESGRYWTAFLKAIAARGPFYNINDERLREEERRAEEIELAKRRLARRRQREAQRKRDASLHAPPSADFMANIEAERNRRRELLLERAGDPTMPPRVRKIPPRDAARTASITANAWMQFVILEAMGYEPRPGTIARRMVEQGLSEGLSYESLKARISNDLDRAVELEVLGIWSPFDPDADITEMSLAELEAEVAKVEDTSKLNGGDEIDLILFG